MGINPSNSRHSLRALVTRPRAEAGGLAEALAGRGIAAILEPMLEIHYRSAPSPDLAGVQAILCTSANGVRALARLAEERAVPIFAVGEASAARARDEGFARVESAGGSVADLARLARELLCPAAGRLLHVAGSVVAGDLAAALGAGAEPRDGAGARFRHRRFRAVLLAAHRRDLRAPRRSRRGRPGDALGR